MSSAVAHAEGAQATLLLSVCAFCRLHLPSELVALWRPDADGRTAHGDPNYRGAHSTADCRSDVTCADGGTDEHRAPYRGAHSTADCRSNVSWADGEPDEHRTHYRSAIPSPHPHPHEIPPDGTIGSRPPSVGNALLLLQGQQRQ